MKTRSCAVDPFTSPTVLGRWLLLSAWLAAAGLPARAAPFRQLAHWRLPHAGGSLLALVLSLILMTLTTPVHAADQFVKVDHPGWTNTSQFSWSGAWSDYDGDGLLDLFVPNSTTSWGAWTNFLYRNNGDGTFTRKLATEAGPIASDKDPSCGAYWGDINNDGRPDLLVANFIASANSPPVIDRVYLNSGDGTFTSADAGDLTKPSYAWTWASLADYDNDGWLDAFVIAAWADSGHRTNLLYHARGDGKFDLVTSGVIATDTSPLSLQTCWCDFDNDGDVDLVVSNYDTANLVGDFFYRNDGGGQFTRLTGNLLANNSYRALCHAWGDYDNDGWMDVALGGEVAYGGTLAVFRNTGSGDFVVAMTTPVSGAPAWSDYDNDGYLDLIVFRGQDTPAELLLFHNDGNGGFEEMEDAFTRDLASRRGGAWGDYDNDGFLDLFAADQYGKNVLYHNLGNPNHWIKFVLEGTVANRAAIGAKVRIEATIGGKTVRQMREVSSDNFTPDGLRLNFGLGDATNVEVVRIEWPSGIVQELKNVAANQIVKVIEPARLVPQSKGGFQIQCWVGQSFEVLGSTDLIQWTPVATVTNETGTLAFEDVDADQHDCRYYRVTEAR